MRAGRDPTEVVRKITSTPFDYTCQERQPARTPGIRSRVLSDISTLKSLARSRVYTDKEHVVHFLLGAEIQNNRRKLVNY